MRAPARCAPARAGPEPRPEQPVGHTVERVCRITRLVHHKRRRSPSASISIPRRTGPGGRPFVCGRARRRASTRLDLKGMRTGREWQSPVDASASRHDQILAAIRWCALSVAWALLVAVTSLAAGFAADSTALVGFGLASLV